MLIHSPHAEPSAYNNHNIYIYMSSFKSSDLKSVFLSLDSIQVKTIIPLLTPKPN